MQDDLPFRRTETYILEAEHQWILVEENGLPKAPAGSMPSGSMLIFPGLLLLSFILYCFNLVSTSSNGFHITFASFLGHTCLVHRSFVPRCARRHRGVFATCEVPRRAESRPAAVLLARSEAHPDGREGRST